MRLRPNCHRTYIFEATLANGILSFSVTKVSAMRLFLGLPEASRLPRLPATLNPAVKGKGVRLIGMSRANNISYEWLDPRKCDFPSFLVDRKCLDVQNGFTSLDEDITVSQSRFAETSQYIQACYFFFFALTYHKVKACVRSI